MPTSSRWLHIQHRGRLLPDQDETAVERTSSEQLAQTPHIVHPLFSTFGVSKHNQGMKQTSCVPIYAAIVCDLTRSLLICLHNRTQRIHHLGTNFAHRHDDKHSSFHSKTRRCGTGCSCHGSRIILAPTLTDAKSIRTSEYRIRSITLNCILILL